MLHGRMVLLMLVSLVMALAAPAYALAQDAGVDPAGQSRAGYLAERLRADPVFVSDHVPRAIPPADAERIREIAARTGVPTYVVALPDTVGEPTGEALLGALHDQLGADGLYVFLGASGTSLAASAYGHDLPAAAAVQTAMGEPAPEGGPVARLERFVDVLVGDGAAAQDADGGSGWLNAEERSFLTGTAASGVPLAALAAVLLVRRARRRATPRRVTA